MVDFFFFSINNLRQTVYGFAEACVSTSWPSGDMSCRGGKQSGFIASSHTVISSLEGQWRTEPLTRTHTHTPLPLVLASKCGRFHYYVVTVNVSTCSVNPALKRHSEHQQHPVLWDFTHVLSYVLQSQLIQKEEKVIFVTLTSTFVNSDKMHNKRFDSLWNTRLDLLRNLPSFSHFLSLKSCSFISGRLQTEYVAQAERAPKS